MTQALIIGAFAIVAVAFLYAFAKIAEAKGEAKAIRERAEKDLADQKKAGTVIAEHRTADDAAQRLSDGSF